MGFQRLSGVQRSADISQLVNRAIPHFGFPLGCDWVNSLAVLQSHVSHQIADRLKITPFKFVFDELISQGKPVEDFEETPTVLHESVELDMLEVRRDRYAEMVRTGDWSPFVGPAVVVAQRPDVVRLSGGLAFVELAGPAYETQHPRLFHVLIDDLPPPVRRAIDADGEATIPFGQIRQFVENRRTKETE